MNVSLEKASDSIDDAKLVMEWRNDPQTLAMFYNSCVNTWPEYHEIYIRKYFSKGSKLGPFFGVYEGKKIAFLNSNQIDDSICDIDINLSRDFRGHGLGRRLIELYTSYLHRTMRQSRVVAEVKTMNISSQKSFERAGYVKECKKTVMRNETSFDIFQYSHDASLEYEG